MIKISKEEWERHKNQLKHLGKRLNELERDVNYELHWMLSDKPE